MSGCTVAEDSPIDPEIGREPWRKSRLVGATGPTGPAGVVQDMRTPTGSFQAITETDLCGCGIPGVLLNASFGFTIGFRNIEPGNSLTYMDGVATLTTLASNNLTAGAWVKVEVVQTPPTIPGDGVARGSLPFVLSSGAPATFVESSAYIYSTPETILPNWLDNYVAGANPTFNFITGPIRITAGYGNVTQHEVFSREPAIFSPSSVSANSCSVVVGLMPYDIQSSTNDRRICCMVSYGGMTFPLPITVPSGFVFGGGQAAASELELCNGVSLEFDTSRVDVQPRVNKSFMRGPAMGGRMIRVVGDNHTDVIVPLNATGPTGSVAPVTMASITARPQYLSLQAVEYGEVPRLPQLDPPEYAHPRGALDVYANASQPDRPDKHDRALFRAANGPTWHERNIIRYGKSLGVDGARHKLSLTFDWQPAIADFLSCTATSGEYVQQPRRNGYPIFGYSIQSGLGPSWQMTLSPTLRLLGGTVLDLMPHIGQRKLMPGVYFGPLAEPQDVVATQAVFPKSIINPDYLTWLDGAAANGGTFQSQQAYLAIEPPSSIVVNETHSVQMSVKRLVHSWASTGVAGLSSQNISPTLPLPGEQGMGLDSYSLWFPEITNANSSRWPKNLPIVGGGLTVNMQAWFGITVTSVSASPAWSGNRVVYRRLIAPQIEISLSDAQCNALSNGDEVSATSAAGDPYRLQFSIVT